MELVHPRMRTVSSRGIDPLAAVISPTDPSIFMRHAAFFENVTTSQRNCQLSTPYRGFMNNSIDIYVPVE